MGTNPPLRHVRGGLVLVGLLLLLVAAEARVRKYQWEVKYEQKSPDCYEKPVITVNGQSPGPTIFAQEDDTVVVFAKNSLGTENLAIHWHGIRQIGTPWYDGADGVTQCPILPGSTFMYRFVVDKAGTFMYHAHYGMQREAGLYGLIVVNVGVGKSEPFAYDGEYSMILNDWYHKSALLQAAGLASKPFVWVGEPQSLLIQGKGKYNCSLVDPIAQPGSICNSTNPECSPFTITVDPQKTYRLRITSITSLSSLSFQIEGHNMTVVEADGNYVEPFETSNLFLYSGETYSVLVKTNSDSTRNYWMTTNVVGRKPATPIGVAILNYRPNNLTDLPPTIPPPGPIWDDLPPRKAHSLAIKAHCSYTTPPPPEADRTITLLNTQNLVDGHIKWSLNNISLVLPETPYLLSLSHPTLQGTLNNTPPPPDTLDISKYNIYQRAENPNSTTGTPIYKLDYGSVVDVILQNANTLNLDNSETHPWHLHGHDFWVMGFGDGLFNPLTDKVKFNTKDPIMKNTVPLFPYGWTAIRFKADNPGVWFFHCHIEPHAFMGMGVVFTEGVEKLGVIPEKLMNCKKVR